MTVAAVALKLVKGVTPPTAPENVVVPDPPEIIRFEPPFKVELKLTFALFEVIVLVPVIKTGLGNERALAPVTVMLLPI